MAPSNLWGSDASSSIYSNAQDPPIDVKPLITRKDSASAQSNHSTASKSSTIYSEESIKSMGYRPFEYWKARKPAGRPPGRPPPPPLALPRFTGTNPMKPVNSLQDFKPLPRAKILEVQTYVMDAAPPSPRVKDRYAARLAERARRKRERQQRIEAWPGWVPDEKVLGRQQQQQQQQHRRRVRIVEDEEEAALSKRASSVSMTLRERWMRPRTWRRRVWGIVVSVGVLVLIAVIIVSTTISQDNAPGLKTARYARLDYRLAETFEAEDLYAPPSSSSTVSSPHSSSLLSSAPALAPARARARRRAHRFRGRNS